MHLRFSRCFPQRSLLLAVACASACGDSRDTAPGAQAGATGGAASAGGAVDGSAGAAARADAGGSSSGGGSAGQGAGGDASGAAGQAPDPGGGSGAEPLPPRLGRYHRSDSDRSLRFELDAAPGLSPYATSLEYLGALVGRVLDKPDGIAFDADETLPPAGSDHAWTFEELDAFSREHARDDAEGPVSIHVLFIDGSYASSEDGGTVLGLAWGQRYIALFQDAIRSGCSGGLLGALSTEACEIAERNVWAHEIGHVIGLVDNGLSPQSDHRDVEHGRHDISDGCLMYWAYDRPAMFDALLSRLDNGQSADVDFCENCWADLSAARR
jgi:hypothetical protein